MSNTPIAVQESNGAISVREVLLANLGLLLMVASWGMFFPILDRLLTLWDFYSATLARQILGAVALVICVMIMRRQDPLPAKIPWVPILVLGGVGIAMGSLLTSLGVLFAGGLSSAIISTANPIVAALTAALLYRQPLGRGVLIGTVLSVLGGLISVAGGRSLLEARFEGGEILIVASNVLWTWMSIAAQRWLRGYSQLQITALTTAAGGFWLLMVWPVVIATEIVELRLDLSLTALGLALFAGLVPIALGNFCWHYGVSRIGIVVASMYNNLLPAIALAATVLMGGTFGLHQLIGSVVIISGVIVVQLLALKKREA